MKIPFRTIILLLCGAGLVWVRCTNLGPVQVAGGASGTEVGACAVSGSVVDPAGVPAAGATVRLRSSRYLADSMAGSVSARGRIGSADTVTDGRGNFRFVLVDTGDFSIEVTYKDSLGKILQCIISPADTIKRIPQDTLRPLSTVSGHIEVTPNGGNQPDLAIVKVYGLERYVRPDSAGNFQITLPPGSHTLFFCSDNGAPDSMEVKVSVSPDERRDIGSFRLSGRFPPPPPCMDYACDSITVRMLLDSAGYFSLPVDSVAQARGGRIVGLNLRGLGLTAMPWGLDRLAHLESIDVSGNKIADIPFLGRLPNLKRLVLRGNLLTALPKDLLMMNNLDTLDVSNNRLSTLPDSITHLAPAGLLDLTNNKLCLVPPAIAAWADAYDADWRASQLCP